MNQITIKHNQSETRLTELGVRQWEVWQKEVSEFPWQYDEREVCFFLAGKVTVTPAGGKPVAVRAGDLVTFPHGLSCTSKVVVPVRKHYRFG
jgi:uncharacterized cupin superfamily protein